MIELLKKIIGWFLPERMAFTAQGEEWQRISRNHERREREQNREIRYLKAQLLKEEAEVRNLRAELEMVKTRLYNIQLKERLDGYDKSKSSQDAR